MEALNCKQDLDQKRKKPDKGGYEDERKNSTNYLNDRCVTCRRQILEGDKVLCPFQRCYVCQGGTCEDCVYKGIGDLRWMCGCCYRKTKETSKATQQENWFFDLNETFDSLKAPTRTKKPCNTETVESHLNDSGAKKCPSESMESQRAYAKNHANQISETSHSSSSNQAREALKSPNKPLDSQHQSNIVHLNDSPTQRRGSINKLISYDERNDCRSHQQYPVLYEEQIRYLKNKAKNGSPSRKNKDSYIKDKNNAETNRCAKDNEILKEQFRNQLPVNIFHKDSTLMSKNIFQPKSKDIQKLNNSLYDNKHLIVNIKDKQKVTFLQDEDNPRFDLSTSSFSDPMIYKRFDLERHQTHDQKNDISDLLEQTEEYYDDASNLEQYFEGNMRSRSYERSRAVKSVLKRNLSVDQYDERRDAQRYYPRIDTVQHSSQELSFDGWDDCISDDRKNRSTSSGRHHISVSNEMERGCSVDDNIYSEDSYPMRRARLERQNTSFNDYYWPPIDQCNDIPNFEQTADCHQILCPFQEFGLDESPNSESKIFRSCQQDCRKNLSNELRHYSERVQVPALMASSPINRLRVKQDEAAYDDYNSRKNYGELKERRSPRSHIYEPSYHLYSEIHSEDNPWKNRSARSLDIPNRSPTIRRASLNEILCDRDRRVADEKSFNLDPNRRSSKPKSGEFPHYSLDDNY